MKTETNEYGLYSWWPPDHRPDDLDPDPFVGLIHPDDEEKAIALNPMGRLFKKLGEECDYYLLQYGDVIIRAKPSNLWRPKKGDGFSIGDAVNVLSLNGKNTPREGIICEIGWHHEKSRAYYLIEENGKRLKKRYFCDDIELLNVS